MKKVNFFLLISLIMLMGVCLAFAQDWGVIRYAYSKTNIHASRSTNSKVIGMLKAGQKVKADLLKDNWYAIFRLDEAVRDERRAIGYVYASLLKPNPPSKNQTTKINPEIIKYRVVAREDVSYRGTPRMVFRVVLETNKKPLEKIMKKTAEHIWRNGNKGWKEFTVFMYLPGMDTEFGAYGIAEFRPYGLKEFKINEYALFGTKWGK